MRTGSTAPCHRCIGSRGLPGKPGSGAGWRRLRRRLNPKFSRPGPRKSGPRDITKLRGPGKGIWFHLYALIDLWSRYSPEYLVWAAEDSIVAADLINSEIVRNGTAPHAVHADLRTPMTSQLVSALLFEVGR